MPELPNLDYEPGPVGASYSRVGPPTEPARPAGGARYELATEIGLTTGGTAPKQPAAVAKRRRAKAK